MNIKSIQEDLEYLKEISGDDEAAHGFEDSMYKEFVQFIVDNYKGEISKMAKELRKTEKIDFARWCA
jgi:hypothetical protein